MRLLGLGRGLVQPGVVPNRPAFRGDGAGEGLLAGPEPRSLSVAPRARRVEESALSDGLVAEAAAGSSPGAAIATVQPSPSLPQPQLSLRLLSVQEAAARSLTADAAAGLATTQAGLRNTHLNLREAPATDLILTSSRDLRLGARSGEQGIFLSSQGSHGAVVSSRIEGGEALGSMQLAAEDALSLVFGAAGEGERPQLDVSERVSALDTSLLSDSGGGDPIRIAAEMAVSIQSPAGMPAPQGVLAVEAAALRESAIVLGDQGADLSISSRLRLSGLPEEGTEEREASFQLVGTAVGLANSHLQSGSGDDRVTISAVVEPVASWVPGLDGRGSLAAVALDHALIQLGGGRDRLLVDGAVRRSRIETGAGTTTWQVNGAIEESVLQLTAGTRVEAELGAQAADLQVVGDGELFLQAGEASDRLRLDGALQGWVKGGEGKDQLVVDVRSGDAAVEGVLAKAEPPLVLLEGPGQGVLGGLHFFEIEELLLPSRASTVWVAPEGSLAGGLRTAAGSSLDYSAWREGVSIDLRQGRATAFAAEEAGGVEGVDEVRGGEGPDHLVGGSTTRRLVGGSGVDRLEFSEWHGLGTSPGTILVGGSGNDLFVLPRLERAGASASITSASITSASSDRLGATARLLDLQLVPPDPLPSPDPLPLLASQSRHSLSDRLALWQPSALQPGGEELVVLQPSGVEGLGDPRLLPLAPLSQLLAGMGDHAPQLAIATGSGGSELVRLDSGSSFQTLLDLPALRLAADRGRETGLRSDSLVMPLG